MPFGLLLGGLSALFCLHFFLGSGIVYAPAQRMFESFPLRLDLPGLLAQRYRLGFLRLGLLVKLLLLCFQFLGTRVETLAIAFISGPLPVLGLVGSRTLRTLLVLLLAPLGSGERLLAAGARQRNAAQGNCQQSSKGQPRFLGHETSSCSDFLRR